MPRKPNSTSKITKTKIATTEITPSVRAGSKRARLIEMLHWNGGSTIAEISSALGWQPHTTRAAITGLRKSGHEVETAKSTDGGSGLTYRIALSAGADLKDNSSSEAGQ